MGLLNQTLNAQECHLNLNFCSALQLTSGFKEDMIFSLLYFIVIIICWQERQKKGVKVDSVSPLATLKPQLEDNKPAKSPDNWATAIKTRRFTTKENTNDIRHVNNQFDNMNLKIANKNYDQALSQKKFTLNNTHVNVGKPNFSIHSSAKSLSDACQNCSYRVCGWIRGLQTAQGLNNVCVVLFPIIVISFLACYVIYAASKNKCNLH